MSKTNFFLPTCVINFKFISLFDRVQNVKLLKSPQISCCSNAKYSVTADPLVEKNTNFTTNIAFVTKTTCRWKVNKMKGDKESNAKLFCFSCRSSTEHPETDRNMTSTPSSPAPTTRRYLHPPQSAAQSTISKSSRRSRRLRSQRPYSPVYSNINYNDVTDRFVQSY